MGNERRNGFSAGDDVDSLYRSYCVTAFSTDMEYRRSGNTGEPGACIPYFDVYAGDIEAADRSGVFFPDCVRHNRKKSSVMVSACLYRLGICRPDLLAGLSSEKTVREPWRRGENYDLKERW